jgi:hypothetical protein
VTSLLRQVKICLVLGIFYSMTAVLCNLKLIDLGHDSHAYNCIPCCVGHMELGLQESGTLSLYSLTPRWFSNFPSIYCNLLENYFFGSAHWQNELEWRCTGVIYPRSNLSVLNDSISLPRATDGKGTHSRGCSASVTLPGALLFSCPFSGAPSTE